MYAERWRRQGAQIGTLGWKDEASQRLRFRVLAEVGVTPGASVCDVGCGFGDLCGYLGDVDYTGVDLVPELLAEARRRFPAGRFERRDIGEDPPPESFDFVLCSGALNYRLADNWAHTAAMVGRMFAMCRRAVAVNFLTTRADFQKPLNYHHDPGAVLALCLALTPRVAIRHDYPLFEFTAYLYREGSADACPDRRRRPLAATPDSEGPCRGSLRGGHRP